MTKKHSIAILAALAVSATTLSAQARPPVRQPPRAGTGQPPKPGVRPTTPPERRGLPPKTRAPRYGWGWGPNVRSPEEGGGKTKRGSRTPVKPKNPATERRDRIALLFSRLAKLAPFTIFETIWGLTSPTGTFGDLDGDGAGEFASVEETPDATWLTIWVKRSGRWRYVSIPLDALRGRGALAPRVLPDDGAGKPAIVVPSRKAPFLYLIPTDGKGGIDLGNARSLQAFLPRPTDNDDPELPFALREVAAGGRDKAAELRGVQRQRVDGQHRERPWTISLVGPRVTSTVGAAIEVEEGVAGARGPSAVLWSDFDKDGNTDALSAQTTREDRRVESSLTYGRGQKTATELIRIGTLNATLEGKKPPKDPLLSFTRTRHGNRDMVCVWFRPWQVGVFVEPK